MRGDVGRNGKRERESDEKSIDEGEKAVTYTIRLKIYPLDEKVQG